MSFQEVLLSLQLKEARTGQVSSRADVTPILIQLRTQHDTLKRKGFNQTPKSKEGSSTGSTENSCNKNEKKKTRANRNNIKLIECCSNANLKSMREMLKKLETYPGYVNVNYPNANTGVTPVMVSAMSKSVDAVDMVMLLCDKGADLEIQDNDGNDVVMHCLELSRSKHSAVGYIGYYNTCLCLSVCVIHEMIKK